MKFASSNHQLTLHTQSLLTLAQEEEILVDRNSHTPHNIGKCMTSLLQIVPLSIVRKLRTSSLGIPIQALIHTFRALNAPIDIYPEAQRVVFTEIVAQRVRTQLLRVIGVVENLLVTDDVNFADLVVEDADLDAGVLALADLAGVQAWAGGVGEGVGECGGGEESGCEKGVHGWDEMRVLELILVS